MTYVGHIWSICWMYPPDYPQKPPKGMPHMLAEIFVPLDSSEAGARQPDVIKTYPIPPGYSVCVRALSTPIKPLPAERLVSIRQKRLRAREKKKAPMFAEQFVAEKIAAKPAYYLEGKGNYEAERAAVLEQEARDFERYTANPHHLFVYLPTESWYNHNQRSSGCPPHSGGCYLIYCFLLSGIINLRHQPGGSMPSAIQQNTLFYGDNLRILREYIPDESVDLIYLDPPFNSNRSYNVLFKEESGKSSEAQITAFDDTWHWGESAEETYQELVTQAAPEVSSMIAALRGFIGENQMMAYLVMMAARLVELRRIVKPTGSLYLHCDPTASHYLKVVLDTIFGVQNFGNEIIWKRTFAHGNVGRNYGSITDIIFWYTKTDKYTWNQIYAQLTEEEIEAKYPFTDADGRRWQSVTLRNPGPRPNLHYPFTASNGVTYHPHPNGWSCNLERMQKYDRENRLQFPYRPDGALRLKMYADESPGERLQNIWDDIAPISSLAAERLGYPTQKPLALLERIIQASSNPGDWVMDPFCGCGTAVAAAHKLDRHWIGIDVTHLAITLQKYRLKDAFSLESGKDYQVIGEPQDLGSAHRLAHDNAYQFQWWALSLVGARPVGGEAGSKQGKKGSDKGIDGVISFIDDPKGKPSTIMVQVKSGGVKSGDLRDLRGVLDREGAAIGVFITLEQPSRNMQTEAVSAGFYQSRLYNQQCPRVQILTIEELLNGKKIDMPPTAYGTFKKAGRIQKSEGTQSELGI